MRAKKRCPTCPNLIPQGAAYCPQCAKRRQWRPSSTRRGYGAAHKRERARLAPLVDSGRATCARCALPILPGEPWDLGHTDDRTAWTGPEHARCNRSAAGKRAHKH